MSKRIAKLIALCLVALMALTACADGGASSPAASTGAAAPASQPAQPASGGAPSAAPIAPAEGAVDMSNVNELGTVPILKEKATLTMLKVTDTNIEDLDTNAYTVRLEENVNVDLVFDYLPADKWKDKLAVMISSGSELADTMAFGLTPIETYTYGSQGFFIPLNDLIANTYYTKNYLDSPDGLENMKYIYSPDGNIYGYPRICEDLGNDWDHRLWINQTWLDGLGLAMPTTTDEYYEVLKAFRDGDPNGNGKADEYPLLGNTNGWNQSGWKPLMYAFTYLNDTFDYMQVVDGKLQLSYMQPEFRTGLEYFAKLCAEGLYSPLSFTQDQNQFKQIIEDQEAQLIGSMTAGSMSVYQVESKRKEDIASMPPLTGPDGYCTTNYRASGIPDAFGFITKDCKDPVAAAMLFDYMWDRDTTLLGRFGVEGEDWKKPEPGVPSMYEAMGYEALIEYINPIWGTLQNHQWGENHPTLRTYDMICGVIFSGNPYDSQYMTAQAVPNYIDKAPKDIVTRLIYTKEEADSIAEILATLNTYRDEAVAAFITGTRPLSDWDKYISELEGIGVARFLEVAQGAYDRMNQQ